MTTYYDDAEQTSEEQATIERIQATPIKVLKVDDIVRLGFMFSSVSLVAITLVYGIYSFGYSRGANDSPHPTYNPSNPSNCSMPGYISCR